MTRRAIVVAAALVVLAVPGAGAADYSDPRGDAGAAPDVTTVSTTATDTSIAFRVVVANMASLDARAELFLAVDTDNSASTGDQHGVDFVYSLREGGAQLRARRWSGSQHVAIASDAAGRYEGGIATFVVPLSELGNPAVIGFGAIGVLGDDSDAAPNDGSWALRLREAVRLTSVVGRFAPSAPRAGSVFRLTAASATLSDGTTRRGAITCTARVSGARLAGRGCSWRLPAGIRGKQLTLNVAIRVPGIGAQARVYRFRIR